MWKNALNPLDVLLVELSNIHVKRQERDPLISLPNVLCLIINDLNRRSNGYGASMDEIKTTLKLLFPEFPLPTDDILYSTIGTLIQDKILLLKSEFIRCRVFRLVPKESRDGVTERFEFGFRWWLHDFTLRTSETSENAIRHERS